MVRFFCALAALFFGLLGLTSSLVMGVIGFKSLGFVGYIWRSLLWGEAATLRYVALLVFGLLALGAMVYGACLDDKLFRRGAWATVILFATACLFRVFQIIIYGNRGAFRIENSWNDLFLAIAACCALAVALRKEELPSLEELLPARRQMRRPARRKSSTRTLELGQAANPFDASNAATPMLPIYVLSIFAILSLLAASFLPVIGKVGGYYLERPKFWGTILLDYSPAFVILMLLPIAVLAASFVTERADLRQLASGAGALLTAAMLVLLLRDALDPARSYTYGLFPDTPGSGLTPDVLGTGFWLLAYSGLCWIGVFFDGFSFLGKLPDMARSASNNKVPRAPLDAVELAQRFLLSTLTFIFCASCFPLGIFLWRYFDEQDNRLVNAALAGWVVGLIWGLFRLFLIFFIGASASDDY